MINADDGPRQRRKIVDALDRAGRIITAAHATADMLPVGQGLDAHTAINRAGLAVVEARHDLERGSLSPTQPRAGDAPAWLARALVERAIDDAQIHGRESEPDHEVGDLQDLARRLARVMTVDQVHDALADWTSYVDPGDLSPVPLPTPPPCAAAPCYAHARPGVDGAQPCEPFPACPGRVNGRPCGKPLHYCREESRECLHCDACGWTGDPVAYRRAHPACLLAMGTLCASHAGGAPAAKPCNATERPASSRRKPRR